MVPELNDDYVTLLVKRLYGLESKYIKRLDSYDDKNFFIEVLPEIKNVNIKMISSNGYVLKVLNSKDSMNLDVIEEQNSIMEMFCISDILVPKPVKNIFGNFMSLESISSQNIIMDNLPKKTDENSQSCQCVVRLFTFVPGKLLKEVPYTKELLHELGTVTVKFDNALQAFVSPAITNRKYRWQLTSIPHLDQYLFVIKDVDNFSLVKEVLSTWRSFVEPLIPALEKGIIHSDLNEQNILVSCNNWNRVCGLLDFGDLSYSPYIFELAIAITYVLLEVNTLDHNEAVSHIVAGYITQRRIKEDEWNVLKECVAGRFIQSLVLGAYAHHVNPDNSYVLHTAKVGWQRLRQLWDTPKDILIASWKSQL